MKAYTHKSKAAVKPRETPGQSCPYTNWGQTLERLGYHLYRNSVDSMGRSWKYRTFPIGAGTIGQFSSLGELTTWVRRIEHDAHLLSHASRDICLNLSMSDGV